MKYKTLIFASLLAAQSQAADWSGCYVGASASYMESSNQWTTNLFQAQILNQDAGSVEADDTALGLQFGCNFLESETWVFGLKLAASDNTLSASHIYQDPTSTLQDNLLTYQIEDVVSLIGRVGFKASDNGLIYGNLGYTQSSHDYRDMAQTPLVFSFRKRESQRGVLIGVGYEHMLTNDFSLFAEYNYTDLGDNDIDLVDLIAAPTIYNATVDQDISQINVGVNFNF